LADLPLGFHNKKGKAAKSNEIKRNLEKDVDKEGHFLR
jgi:hypothetical protein